MEHQQNTKDNTLNSDSQSQPSPLEITIVCVNNNQNQTQNEDQGPSNPQDYEPANKVQKVETATIVRRQVITVRQGNKIIRNTITTRFVIRRRQNPNDPERAPGETGPSPSFQDLLEKVKSQLSSQGPQLPNPSLGQIVPIQQQPYTPLQFAKQQPQTQTRTNSLNKESIVKPCLALIAEFEKQQKADSEDQDRLMFPDYVGTLRNLLGETESEPETEAESEGFSESEEDLEESEEEDEDFSE